MENNAKSIGGPGWKELFHSENSFIKGNTTCVVLHVGGDGIDRLLRERVPRVTWVVRQTNPHKSPSPIPSWMLLCGAMFVRVRLDLSMELLRRTVIDFPEFGEELIKYERLPEFCQECGLMGHPTSACFKKLGIPFIEEGVYE